MDIAVDLNLLKAFDALMSERAVTRAASRIGLSQPAMSHALSRLRGLFSDDLFVRTPGGMEPTARAREIAPLGLRGNRADRGGAQPRRRVRPGHQHRDIHRRHGRIRRGRAGRPPRAGVLASGAQSDPAPPVNDTAATPPSSWSAARSMSRWRICAQCRRRSKRRSSSATRLSSPSARSIRSPGAADPLTVEAYAAQNHVLVSPRGDPSRRARPHPRGLRPAPPYRAPGRDLSGGAGCARRLGPDRHGAEPRRQPRSPPTPRSPSCRCRSISPRPCRWPGTAAPPANRHKRGSGVAARGGGGVSNANRCL